MPLSARRRNSRLSKSSAGSGPEAVDPSTFTLYGSEADDDTDVINHNETWPTSKSTGTQLTFERLNYMGSQVERIKSMYVSASMAERRNSFLQSVGATWELEEESFIDEGARHQMEEHFAKSCKYDPNDLHLLEMLGGECEERLFKDQQRVLAYFRHKAAIIERHHGFRYGADIDKTGPLARRGHREAVILDANVLQQQKQNARPDSSASSSSSSSSGQEAHTASQASQASSPKGKKPTLRGKRPSGQSQAAGRLARSSTASRLSNKSGRAAKFISNASDRSNRSGESDGEDDNHGARKSLRDKEGPRPSSSGKPSRLRKLSSRVKVEQEAVVQEYVESGTPDRTKDGASDDEGAAPTSPTSPSQEPLHSTKRRMSRKLSTRKGALPAILQNKK